MKDRHMRLSILQRSLASVIRPVLAPLGLQAAGEADLRETCRLARRLISPRTAELEVYRAVHRRTGGAAVWVFREEGAVTGALAIVPLSPLGLDALLAETFQARAPDLAHIATARERPAAVYGWGVLGATSAGRRAAMGGTQALIERAFPDIPWFARAATPDGERVALGRLGYAPLARSTSGLLTRAPLSQERAA
jgi:hypothetical protein